MTLFTLPAIAALHFRKSLATSLSRPWYRPYTLAEPARSAIPWVFLGLSTYSIPKPNVPVLFHPKAVVKPPRGIDRAFAANGRFRPSQGGPAVPENLKKSLTSGNLTSSVSVAFQRRHLLLNRPMFGDQPLRPLLGFETTLLGK
jgi:hypothetical protein